MQNTCLRYGNGAARYWEVRLAFFRGFPTLLANDGFLSRIFDGFAHAFHVDSRCVVHEFAGKFGIRAQLAGFDGVELFAAYHALIDQFWTPWSNRRDHGAASRWAHQNEGREAVGVGRGRQHRHRRGGGARMRVAKRSGTEID